MTPDYLLTKLREWGGHGVVTSTNAEAAYELEAAGMVRIVLRKTRDRRRPDRHIFSNAPERDIYLTEQSTK